MQTLTQLAAEQSPATEQSGEAVAWQFYDQGRWHNGNDQVKDHRKNTEAAGIPTRDLYSRPQPAQEPVNQQLLAALKECDEAMAYMSEYDIPATLPGRVKEAIAAADAAPATGKKCLQVQAVPDGLAAKATRLADWCDENRNAVSGSQRNKLKEISDCLRALRALLTAAPQTPSFLQVYRAKLKSRSQMEREIPPGMRGWWFDVSAGCELRLRQATQSDLDRCTLADGQSRNPDDYMCEIFERGSLVSRIAIEFMNAERNVFVAAPQPAQQLPSVIEEIAQQWDGCIYDSPSGDIDIGWAIRAAGK
ncbi:hypothetical protein, partial [Chromobacterium violaceum]